MSEQHLKMSTAEEVFAAMKEAVSAGDEGKALQRKFKGIALFLVDEKKYSLDLSSSDSCSVNEGDTFDGNADLVLTCSEEVMGKMVRKEIQPQQGE
jgi:putative sterol carrier protein